MKKPRLPKEPQKPLKPNKSEFYSNGNNNLIIDESFSPYEVTISYSKLLELRKQIEELDENIKIIIPLYIDDNDKTLGCIHFVWEDKSFNANKYNEAIKIYNKKLEVYNKAIIKYEQDLKDYKYKILKSNLERMEIKKQKLEQKISKLEASNK
jgi:hypothetical protein